MVMQMSGPEYTYLNFYQKISAGNAIWFFYSYHLDKISVEIITYDLVSENLKKIKH